MHYVNELFHVIYRRLGQDAMAQIEDVAKSVVCPSEHVFGFCFDHLSVRHQDNWIEVALNCNPIKIFHCLIEIYSPVDADYGASCSFH